MKLISKAAMASALALGAVATLGSPAIAAKKEKQAKAGDFKLSEPVRTALAAAQKAIAAKDYPTATAELAKADAASKEPDEVYMTSQVRLQLGTESKNEAIQAEGIKGALASGRLPAEQVPQFTFFNGKFQYDKGDFAGAKASLAEAERLGYKDTNLYLLAAEANFKTNTIQAGLAYIEKAIAAEKAAGKAAPEGWYARATSMAYNAKPPLPAEVGKWTQIQLKAFPTDENWRSALVIYRDGSNLDPQASLDLMRLMRMTKSLKGERDYYEYATGAFDRGIYGEAKAVLDEGKASGTFAASNQAINDLYSGASAKIAADKGSLAAGEKEAASAKTFRTASGTADAFMGYGEYARAIPLYKIALEKGGDADTMNTRIGIAQVHTGDLAGARASFAKVNASGPRGQLAGFWTLYLDLKAGGAPAASAATGK